MTFEGKAGIGEQLSYDSLRIQFRRAGSGPALVLVHGLLGYSFSWRGVIPTLARDYEVFALDMPGAGFSDCRADLECRLVSAANRLLGFLDAAGVQSCHLVGSSYGGATAALVSGLAPGRVRSLTLVSPANPWSRIGRKRLTLLRNRAVAFAFPKVARAARPLHKYFVRRMWGDKTRITQETLEGYSLPLVRPGVFEHAVRIVRTWREDMAELERTFSRISAIPVLLVWGSKDRVVDPESAKELQRALPASEFAVIEGAGHLPYEERPEEFCQILQDFLRNQASLAIARTAREVT